MVCSRSFAKPVSSEADLKAAISTYASIAALKLRKEKLKARGLHVFIATNQFQEQIPQYFKSIRMTLPQPTSFTPQLISVALHALKKIYKPGYGIKKAGVMLTELTPQQITQLDLFYQPNPKEGHLIEAVDQINERWGKNMVQFAAAGINKPWNMRQSYKSPAYTTNWQEIPVVLAG